MPSQRQNNDTTLKIFTKEPVKTLLLKKVKLVISKGAMAGKEFVIDKGLLRIGSKKENDVVIADDTVSRFHAQIEEKKGQYIIKDLESTNGTFVNGLQVSEAFLNEGSIIKLGNTELRFIPVEEKIELTPSKKDRFGDIVGKSKEMKEVFGILEKVSKTDATILISGETGTGKELVAKAIHKNSLRARNPFVVIDCGSIARSLIESELFGHEKGAFTGAASARQGAFETAHTGTIFLDEIGELELEMQPRLLRVLEEREVRRVGSTKTMPVDVRIIAATNRDLSKEIKAGRFREDLFYRLSVIQIELPSLRERKDDIPLLIDFFIKESKTRKVKGAAPETLKILANYNWPGNIRELRNVIDRAIALGASDYIEPKDLILLKPSEKQTADLSGKTLEEIEKSAIIQTLKAHKGNKTTTAKALGIAYSTLFEKMK
ncbi:MAG: sigma 54-dependent Fis family transcriptional regulator, partial [Nitrospirae bacterium]|nr:sigma 54-dependent Fis family transcriptional regulator [Nitrospirota bacterium]